MYASSDVYEVNSPMARNWLVYKHTNTLSNTRRTNDLAVALSLSRFFLLIAPSSEDFGDENAVLYVPAALVDATAGRQICSRTGDGSGTARKVQSKALRTSFPGNQ